jgi:phage major head subunit gpT-like protein
VNRATARLEVWPHLAATTNPNAWFLYDEGSPYRPFVYQEEKPLALLSVTDPEDSHVLLKKEVLNQAYGRYNVGLFMPQLIIGGRGTD